MKKTVLGALCMLAFNVQAQNLIQNPQFDATRKVTNWSQIHRATQWSDANGGSVDLFSNTACRRTVSVPCNFAGSQESEGNEGSYIGFTAFYDDQRISLWKTIQNVEITSESAYGRYSEYPQGTLSEPLTAGQTYTFSFQVSLADKSARAVKGLGVYFSKDPLSATNNALLSLDPQIVSTNFVTDKTGWTTIGGEYTARGGEHYFIIGAFDGKFEVKSLVTPKKENDNKRAYYYLKGVVLTKVTAKDSDGDGLLDKDDDCPTVYGTVKGCPDKDKDGIADKNDECPDVFGVAELNGCPKDDKDSDGDGISDSKDDCPTVYGTVKGCPDRDKDGVADKDDECPDVRGLAALNGCALSKTEREAIRKASEAIYFNTGSAVIKEESYDELDELADLLKKHPEVEASIEGHTDSQGNDAANLKLSKARAKAVRDYLVSKGIQADHLSSEGYGETQPIADNGTAEGRAKNRRVVIQTSSFIMKSSNK